MNRGGADFSLYIHYNIFHTAENNYFICKKSLLVIDVVTILTGRR